MLLSSPQNKGKDQFGELLDELAPLLVILLNNPTVSQRTSERSSKQIKLTMGSPTTGQVPTRSAMSKDTDLGLHCLNKTQEVL